MTPNTEIELKFLLRPGRMDALLRAPALLAAGDPQISNLRAVYFDTPDLALRRKGVVLRLRHDGRRTVQTVKSAGTALGRGEWESVVAGDQPDLAAAKGSPAEILLDKSRIRNELRPVFTVEVERRTLLLERDGSLVEAALDTGVIRAGDEEHALCELELELKRGSPEALFAAAREIAPHGRGVLSFTSKSERGYRLLRGELGAPRKKPAFDVCETMSAGEAAFHIGQRCAAALFDNCELLLATRDVEALHQARVSARRLRAFWSLFGPVLDGAHGDAPEEGLKWISGLLGEARDLDVFLAETLPAARNAHPDAAGFDGLERAISDRRDASYDALEQALESERFLAMSLDLARALAADGLDAGMRSRPVLDVVRGALDRRLRKVLKQGDDLAALDADERHRVRIRAKKLRYMVEPFEGLAPRKDFKRLLEGLNDLQDELGAMNDVRVSAALMTGLAQDAAGIHDPRTLFAAGLIAAAPAAGAHTLLKGAQAAHDGLRRVTPFWSA
ncbi:CHAD domain-containing protein [Alsobacter sp. KACC 23698]|uniref:CHAD domain-containing protein n=1 Tax=Alsobacter sp. KACC 23698 TaxID=3149229 RepID=A0AAU7JGH2_9HYPH